MIQRIQSIYMLVVSALTVFLMCSDIFTLYSKAETYEVGSLFVNGKDGESLYSVWPVFALLLLSAVVAFAAIFMYKSRLVQMRVNIFNMVLILGVCIVIAGYGFLLSAKYEGMTVAPNYGVLWVLPVNLILSYLALRAIGKDEALVRSLDRLR